MKVHRVVAFAVLAAPAGQLDLSAQVDLSAQAQRAMRIEGTLVGSHRVPDSYWVEFRDLEHKGFPHRTQASALGIFQLHDIHPGSYEVSVTDPGGLVVKRDIVKVDQRSHRITLRVPTPEQRPVGGGAISVARLQHKVPNKAMKEFRKSAGASRKGNPAKAMRHLEKAVELDTEFLEARINLGAAYTRAGRPADAVPHFEEAVKIDPLCYEAFQNLGMVLTILGDFHGAERAARQAVQLNPGADKARYLLGMVLGNLGKYPEAMFNLRRSSEALPQSRIYVAIILARSGMIEEARAELQAFLALDAAPERHMAEQVLAQINRETGRSLQRAQAREQSRPPALPVAAQ
ncbi:MAG: tetratricopeptide repeat protein [bacterium]|nr:tetratricopeptide repeat protein [bacterium]